MYFTYGFPRALNTGVTGADEEAIYCSNTSPEFVIVVFSSTVQVWSGSQHRVKLGETHRSQEQVEEEGPNVRAHWCPQKRVLAVATSHNRLQLYALNVSSEALWRLPDSQEVRRVNVYLSHSIHLDYGAVRVADVGGDAKSLLVALSNGTMQVFSWQGKLRGQANPFIAAYEGSRSRRQQARTASINLDRTSGTLGVRPSPFSSSGADLAGSGGSNGSLASSAPPPAPPSRTSSGNEVGSFGLGGSSRLLDAMDSLPLPTPAQPADVAVACIHYAPAARMLAVVLRDGRCALCRTADSGIHPPEQLQLFRWVFKPVGADSPAAVAAALNPTAQLLALGMSHGRVAIYTLQSLLSVRGARSSGSRHSIGGAADAHGHGHAAGAGSGQPEPTRVLSLADWGYRSAVVGPASVLRWSPDGRVLAVGYAERGLAVWTPSGCRLTCSLRQAVATGNAPGAPSSAGLAAAGMQQSTTSLPPAGHAPDAAAAAAAGPHASPARKPAEQRGGSGGGEAPPAGSPRKSAVAAGASGGLWSQHSGLNPGQAPEAGVLEGGVSALTWSVHGYQLLVAEVGQARSLHQLEFARYMHGSHRVVQQAAGGGGAGSGLDEVQALQAADRVLLISEARQIVNPALRVPGGAAEAAEGEGVGVRPDLSVQHVKLPQQYIEAAYPVLHASISQSCGEVAVAGTRGLALYSRRARRWRLFGDATQEKNLRVQGLMWLPGGIIAACAYVDGKEGGGAPQLLLYPQYHLDNASLLARLPLKQVPVAMDSAGWHMVLAFAPLEVRLFRVTVEGPLGPSGRPIARLAALRELSIMGLGNPLQEIALIDPLTGSHPGSSGSASASQLDEGAEQEPPAGRQEQQAQQAQQEAADGAAAAAADGSAWPQLKVATRARPEAGGGGGDAPLQCVLLRAGGIMSKLDLQEGSEVLLSDAIERFWLPISAAAALAGGPPGLTSSLVSRVSSSGFVASAAGARPAAGSAAATPPLSSSSSAAALARAGSEGELAAASVAAASYASYARLEQQQAAALVQQAQLEGVFQLEARQPPRVEMPWWTYGARGMQLWFPSSLSEPLTPSLRSLSLTSPTATGLAAAAAAAATNSTDPELEFDREVYPIGVSLAEVSIIGVVQRTVRSQLFPPEAAQSLLFQPLPESQPVLPCLLRRLLQKGRSEDALELARWHSGGPHFNRSLEWLLFTALEFDAEQRHAAAPVMSSPHGGGRPARQRFNSSYAVTVGSLQPAEQASRAAAAAAAGSPPAGRSGLVSPRSVGVLSAAALAQRRAGPLLVAAARLISQFPQFPEIVVSVARKTDAALWPSLFAAVGSPARLCQGLMQTEKLQSAACCLVIVEQIEGSAQAQHQALQLIQAALDVGQYGLAADLLRFLVPPGEAEAVLDAVPAPAPAADKEAAAQTVLLGPVPEGEQEAEGGTPRAQQAQQQQQEQQQEQQEGGGSWFWGLFGGGGEAGAAPAAAPAAGAAPPAGGQLRPQPGRHAAAAEDEEEEEEDGAAATEAWRLTAHHAWRLLDSGALRDVTLLSRSLAELHGGLPALLTATAGEVPAARAHLAPSAAAIASALFVAANEFASADQEADAALAAEQLLEVCSEAGCVNLAAALALLLGDQRALQQFMERQPAVWADLHTLIANDVHLCGYAPVLSPLPSPMMAPAPQHGAAQLMAA